MLLGIHGRVFVPHSALQLPPAAASGIWVLPVLPEVQSLGPREPRLAFGRASTLSALPFPVCEVSTLNRVPTKVLDLEFQASAARQAHVKTVPRPRSCSKWVLWSPRVLL